MWGRVKIFCWNAITIDLRIMVSDVISKLLITLLNEDIFKIEKWQFKKKMSCLDGQVTHFTEMNFLHIRILPTYIFRGCPLNRGRIRCFVMVEFGLQKPFSSCAFTRTDAGSYCIFQFESILPLIYCLKKECFNEMPCLGTV